MIKHEAMPVNPFEGYEDITENIRMAKSLGFERGASETFVSLVEWLGDNLMGEKDSGGKFIARYLDEADWQSLLQSVKEGK